MSQQQPLVSIIIINYNTYRITCNCIDSVIRYTHGFPYEIILVDNASPKDNPDEFIKEFPGIKLVKSKENGGFAKGNNLGISHASGDIILLLNSDTILKEDSISKAANFLINDSRTGALGVRLVYPDGKLQSSGRKFRSIRNEVLDIFRPFIKLLPYRKRATLMLNQYFKGDFNTNVDWVSGAFIMFRKSLVEQLPEKKLDERFFMYGEDELWCYQFTELGYKNYFLAETEVIHLVNASTEPGKQLRLLKTLIDHEMTIMQYAHGKSVYFYAFQVIFKTKEMLRYYIKVILSRLFNFQLR